MWYIKQVLWKIFETSGSFDLCDFNKLESTCNSKHSVVYMNLYYNVEI